MDFKEILWECGGWIHLAQGRNNWRAAVSTIMKSGSMEKGGGVSLPAEELVTCQEELCWTELCRSVGKYESRYYSFSGSQDERHRGLQKTHDIPIMPLLYALQKISLLF